MTSPRTARRLFLAAAGVAAMLWVGIARASWSTLPARPGGTRVFDNPERVIILGYDGDAMEPFVTRDGRYLFFNNLNDPSVDTNLHYAERVDDLTFQYKGQIEGANTSALEGVPTMDRNDVFYFVSPRTYGQTMSTIYRGVFANGRVSGVELVPGISKKQPGIVNFDVEVSPEGNTLYFVDGKFGNGGPETADIVVAERRGAGFERLSSSAEILRNVNSSALEYAPCIAADGLTLFFTRAQAGLAGLAGGTAIFMATRRDLTAPFDEPVHLAALDGFVEGPTLSPDERSLYYHRKEGNRFVIDRVTRQDARSPVMVVGPRPMPRQLPGRPMGSGWGESIAFSACDERGVSQIVLAEPDGRGQRAITDASTSSWFPAWSPDGTRILFARESAGQGGIPQLWIMDSDGSEARALVSEGVSLAGSWSPDGRQIAYAHGVPGQGLKIWIARADGSQARRLTNATGPAVDENVPRWSPDGARVTFTSNLHGRYEIWVADVVSGDATSLTRAYFDSQLNADIEQKVPAWSPDGELITFWSGVEGSDPRPNLPRDVWVMNADGTGQKRLVEGDDPNWSPSGEFIIRSAHENGHPVLGIVRPDGDDARVLFTVAACRPLQSSWFRKPQDALWGSIASAAQIVFMTPTGSQPVPGSGVDPGAWELVVMNLDGSGRKQVTHNQEQEFLPHFSPDGTRLLYTRFTSGGYGVEGSQSRVTVYDFATESTRDLTNTGKDSYPVWSPDGTRIAFLSYATRNPGQGGPSLWVMNADGSDAHEIGHPSGDDFDLVWGDIAWSSQDWILFVVGEKGMNDTCFKTRLDEIRPDGTERTKVTDGGPNCTPAGMEQSGDADPGFSADGATIYTSRGFPTAPPGIPGGTIRRLYAVSSDAWYPGKPEGDLSLASAPNCIEGVPKGSPDGTGILLFRFCAGEPAGVTVTDAEGSYRTWIADGFGPDWNPAWKP